MTTETHQLTIARAIAYVLKEPWAVWASKSHPDPDCEKCCGAGGRRDDDVPDQWYPCECLRTVPLTTLADARAAWVASGGDPERGPALEFRSVDLEWLISDNAEWVHTRSGRLWASCRAPDAWEWTGIGTTEDAALLARIIRAVEEVTRAA
jgi:hypothetical protein